MSLAPYHKKRDFARTPEPRGERPKARGAGEFIVHKHAARRLHYDLRLELGGVLKSWAVPKGPSLDPHERRLAVHVEDHPLEYGQFEGTIPQGEYGGGTVVLWDRGRWYPEDPDPDAAYHHGKLKFHLDGEKLHGGYTLVRMHSRRDSDRGKDNWLLIKEHDDEAADDGERLVRDRPESVLSGRTIEQVAVGEPAKKTAKKTAAKKATKKTATKSATTKKTTTQAAAPSPGAATRSATRKSTSKKTAKETTTKKTAIQSPATETSAATKDSTSKKTAPQSPAAKTSAAKKKATKSVAKKKATKKTTKSARSKQTAAAKPSAARKIATKRATRSAGRKSATTTINNNNNNIGANEQLPERVAPALATLVDALPTGDEWLHEIKYDGYRLLARIDRDHVQLITRGDQDWTERLTSLAEALRARLGRHRALVDGELVHLDAEGITRVGPLQRAIADRRVGGLVFYAFDLLYLDGEDLRDAPLDDRKQRLEALLPPESTPGRVRLSEHFIGDASALLASACEQGLEGLISKRRDAPYRSARTRDWRKIKCGRRQEVVVGGYTPARSGPRAIGALLVGVFDDSGKILTYSGKVGTGFDHDEAARLYKQLAARAVPRSPFADKLPADVARSRFVRPGLVVEVRFSEWTRDGRMRHPVYEAVREDKRPHEVVREVAAPATPQGAVQVMGVPLSNPRRVLFPGDGITKRDLADYYYTIADWIVPHVVGRPLSLVRCPNGVGRPCFFQRHMQHELPEGIDTLARDTDPDEPAYLYIHDARGLIGLAQIGALELHVWGATAAAPRSPDRMIFDLDPGDDVPWHAVKAAARALHDRLHQLDLDSFLKTTGGKGLHVVVPLVAGEQDWPQVKRFARGLADEFVRADPEHYIAVAAKARRRGKIYLDYLRNDRAASSIAPYSPRARPGAPVSVPLRWSELPGLESSQVYTLNNVVARLDALRSDPWRAIGKTRQVLKGSLVREIARSR